MVTIYNTTLSATSQRHFSDSLGGGGVLGEGRDGMRGGSRAAQSRVKSGVQGARWSSGGMLGGVQGEMERGKKMACEITSDAILPI